MTAGPGDDRAAALRGRRRVSHAEREQAIGTLKAAFVQGRLTKDEFDARIGQALACPTYAELAAVSADLPAAPPAREPARFRLGNVARWGASGFVALAVLAAGGLLATLRGDGRYEAVAFVVAFVYFVAWLSVGANMAWEWHCMSQPAAGMCVRCAHTAAAHRTPATCAVRVGSPTLWRRCACAGYVPPGVSPEIFPVR